MEIEVQVADWRYVLEVSGRQLLARATGDLITCEIKSVSPTSPDCG